MNSSQFQKNSPDLGHFIFHPRKILFQVVSQVVGKVRYFTGNSIVPLPEFCVIKRKKCYDVPHWDLGHSEDLDPTLSHHASSRKPAVLLAETMGRGSAKKFEEKHERDSQE